MLSAVLKVAVNSEQLMETDMLAIGKMASSTASGNMNWAGVEFTRGKSLITDVMGGHRTRAHSKEQILISFSYGRLVCADGRMYEGQWKDDKVRHLLDICSFDIASQPHGGGRFSHTAEGISYRGEWSNGRAHGRGTYEGKMWGRYTGQWAEDRKEGLGRVEFAGGNSYEGNWVNDMVSEENSRHLSGSSS